MKKIILILFFICSFSLANEKLVFGGIKGSVFNKVATQILSEAYKKLGFDIEVKSYPAKRSLIFANKGEIDGEVQRIYSINEKFKNLIRVEMPFNQVEVTVFSMDKNLKISSWEDIKPYKVVVRSGIKYAEKGTRGAKSVISTGKIENMVNLLLTKRVDLLVYSKDEILRQLKQKRIKNIYKLSPPIKILPLYHFLHKKHSHLAPKIAKVLAEMLKSGEVERIKQKALLEYYNE